ncbi:DUF86 domain-containing protein [Luteococcus peritonei]|uniref:DUF86 domain-containing protein n=1 Tax=Luteococcus peritonei TaxID=88874 RepID=A0ABW4RVT7_9ACTN
MSRSDEQRLSDILASIDRCREYATHFGDEQLGEMAYEAVLRNLAVIGEAVRALSDETKDAMSQVPWPAIAGLRNVVIHEYFRIDRDLVEDIVHTQLEVLRDVIDSRG